MLYILKRSGSLSNFWKSMYTLVLNLLTLDHVDRVMTMLSTALLSSMSPGFIFSSETLQSANEIWILI